MTESQRNRQLRDLSLSRETIGDSISDINKVILQESFDEKIIKELVMEHLENLSLDGIKNLFLKLSQFG